MGWKVLRANQRPFLKPPMNPDTEIRLRERFREDVLALQEMLGRDFSACLPAEGEGGR